MAHLERHKRYPPGARQRRKEGVVHVRFTIDPGGNLQTVQLARSSGHPELDDAVLALLRRASPVPAPPPDRQFVDSDWKPVTDPAQRRDLVQGWLERWGVERLPSIYGFRGAWLVLTLFSFPYVLLPVRAALRGLDPSLEEAVEWVRRRSGAQDG